MPPLPVELCQAILRHSIYVPGFFDPDAFEGDLKAFGFGGAGVAEKPYWGAERTRNTLRRVCWAWNEYLIGFEHRLVNMSDVMHGRVEKMFLKRAMRISFYQGGCWCTDVCVVPSADDADGHEYIHHRFANFCEETIRRFGFLPAEIVDIGSEFAKSLEIKDAMGILKRAKVLISENFYNTRFTRLFTQTANVEHIHGHISEIGHLGSTAQNLVTVSLEVTRWTSEEKDVPELPSLRHLRIDNGNFIESSEYFGGVLTLLLQKVGDQLRSFYIDTRDHDYQMPVDIWGKCPNLERFHPGMELAVSPSMSHPLHTLSIMPKHLSHAATLQFPNLRRLILDGHWRKIGPQDVNDLVSIRTTSLIDRVKVEDLNGIPLAVTLEDTNTALTRN